MIPEHAPSVVLVNGRVRTLELASDPLEAIAIGGGRIVAVGSTDEVRAALPGATTLDLDGSTVLPGFTDSHMHFKRASAFLSLYIDFDSVEPATIADVTREVGSRVSVEPPGTWIQGDGLEPGRLEEKRFPTRGELDRVAADNPVVLRSVGRHVVAANSLALERAGIDATTPDPPGGRIERDEQGQPTGVLHEEAKLRLDANRSDSAIPPNSNKDRIAALSRAVELLHSNGIVAIHEMPRDPDQVSDWLQLREQEEPRVRVRFYIRGGPELAARRHRIEHAHFPPRPGQLERLRDLGLILSMQPASIEAVGDTWRRVFEDDRLEGVMPVVTAMDLGIRIQFNSDFPCAKLNPFVGIKAAVIRQTSSGHTLDASQAVDTETALRFMTHQPAHTAFEETWRGYLRPGYAADLVVLDRDPLETPPDDLDLVEVVKTIVGGKTVFTA